MPLVGSSRISSFGPRDHRLRELGHLAHAERVGADRAVARLAEAGPGERLVGALEGDLRPSGPPARRASRSAGPRSSRPRRRRSRACSRCTARIIVRLGADVEPEERGRCRPTPGGTRAACAAASSCRRRWAPAGRSTARASAAVSPLRMQPARRSGPRDRRAPRGASPLRSCAPCPSVVGHSLVSSLTIVPASPSRRNRGELVQPRSPAWLPWRGRLDRPSTCDVTSHASPHSPPCSAA